jgi:predicted RNA-binding protein associated with RNAse of E/G family
MLQRPGDGYAVWVFWEGPERHFDSWYINLQEPFRRSELGYDTQDLELDIVVLPDLSWQLKDDDVSEERILEGRYTVEQMREAGAGKQTHGPDRCR